MFDRILDPDMPVTGYDELGIRATTGVPMTHPDGLLYQSLPRFSAPTSSNQAVVIICAPTQQNTRG